MRHYVEDGCHEVSVQRTRDPTALPTAPALLPPRTLLSCPRPAGSLFFSYCWLVGVSSESSGLEFLMMFLVYLQKNKVVKKVRKGEERERAPRGSGTAGVRREGRGLAA